MESKDDKIDIEYDGESFSIIVSDTKLNGNIWKPEGIPEFVYIFVHGLGAFVTFKKDFFHIINEKHGVVFGCDHLGHGISEGKRASCTVDEVIDETIQVINLANERYPTLPIVIHGHSFGGLCTIETFLTAYDDIKDKNIKCVIAEAPWISQCPQHQINRFEKFGIKFLNAIAPNAQIDPGIDLFSPDLNKEWVEVVDNSPLYAKKVTPRLLFSVQNAHQHVRENVKDWPKEIPLLFCQGTDDTLVDAKENGEWVKMLQDQEDVDVTYKIYDNCPHVLLECPFRHVVAKDILDFIDEHIH